MVIACTVSGAGFGTMADRPFLYPHLTAYVDTMDAPQRDRTKYVAGNLINLVGLVIRLA